MHNWIHEDNDLMEFLTQCLEISKRKKKVNYEITTETKQQIPRFDYYCNLKVFYIW